MVGKMLEFPLTKKLNSVYWMSILGCFICLRKMRGASWPRILVSRVLVSHFDVRVYDNTQVTPMD